MSIFPTETKKYRCKDCGEIYFLRVPTWDNDKKCPKCGSKKAIRVPMTLKELWLTIKNPIL